MQNFPAYPGPINILPINYTRPLPAAERESKILLRLELVPVAVAAAPVTVAQGVTVNLQQLFNATFSRVCTMFVDNSDNPAPVTVEFSSGQRFFVHPWQAGFFPTPTLDTTFTVSSLIYNAVVVNPNPQAPQTLIVPVTLYNVPIAPVTMGDAMAGVTPLTADILTINAADQIYRVTQVRSLLGSALSYGPGSKPALTSAPYYLHSLHIHYEAPAAAGPVETLLVGDGSTAGLPLTQEFWRFSIRPDAVGKSGTLLSLSGLSIRFAEGLVAAIAHPTAGGFRYHISGVAGPVSPVQA